MESTSRESSFKKTTKKTHTNFRNTFLGDSGTPVPTKTRWNFTPFGFRSPTKWCSCKQAQVLDVQHEIYWSMHCLGSQKHPTGCLTTNFYPKRGPEPQGTWGLLAAIDTPKPWSFQYWKPWEKYGSGITFAWKNMRPDDPISTESSFKSKTKESVHNRQNLHSRKLT